MSKIKVEIKRLDNYQVKELPKYATENSAGFDLTAGVDQERTIISGARMLMPTGISIAIPDGYELQLRPRSGIAFKNGVTVLNSPGTIDADYRGELKVLLINHSENDFIIKPGDRIAQAVLSKIDQLEWQEVDNLDSTDRGAGGFGSTGV